MEFSVSDVFASSAEPDSFERDQETFLLYDSIFGAFDFSNQEQLDAEYRQMIPPDILASEQEKDCLEKDLKTFLWYDPIDTPFDFSNQEQLDVEYRQMRLIFSLIKQLQGD